MERVAEGVVGRGEGLWMVEKDNVSKGCDGVGWGINIKEKIAFAKKTIQCISKITLPMRAIWSA